MKLLAFLCIVVAAWPARADEALWKLVAGGGQVLFLRHAQTTPGVGDPPGFKLADCSTQRNLSEEGRSQARRLGETFRQLKVPVEEALASPWCRCVETAKLALGRSRNWEPLSNLFGRQENAAAQVRELRTRIAGWRGKGNLVLVSHGSTAAALTGINPDMGEFLVLTPGGKDGFRVAGRLSAKEALPSPHAIEIPAWFTETLLDLREDVREAAAQKKRVMLYFGQDGCPYCTTLMRTNFSQQAIVEKTRRQFVAIALNIWGDREVTGIDGKAMPEKEFARALRVQYTPTLLFLDEKGAVALRLNGYYPPHRFDAALDYAAGVAGKGTTSFGDYMKTAVKESASPTLHDDPLFSRSAVELRGRKPVALFFETPYCSGCDELHREGLKRAEVRKLLERFAVYRLTLDDKRAAELGIAYTPSIVLFDGGKEAFRIEAYVRPFHLAGALEYVASGAYRKEPSFQRFLQARAERQRERGRKIDLWN